ncbi:MAG TPA: hypothetical protein VE891_02560 [Allosphingosinicella sp.]|nr:hypothetical protein [Allosphingosinicella sp.]
MNNRKKPITFLSGRNDQRRWDDGRGERWQKGLSSADGTGAGSVSAGAPGAHRVIAERNNGGEMVEEVLPGADSGLPVTLVHAKDGKETRAEPVAVLFETGRAKFAGTFPELEDELAGFTPAGWQGNGASPDRADAMVWAMTELAVKPQGPSLE